MKTLLTEADVLEYSYGIKPQPVNLGAETGSVKAPELVPVVETPAAVEPPASEVAVEPASPEPAQPAQPQSLDELVESLKSKFTAKQLTDKAVELGLDPSGLTSKTDVATLIAQSMLGSAS